jgi:hypothetical protein
VLRATMSLDGLSASIGNGPRARDRMGLMVGGPVEAGAG